MKTLILLLLFASQVHAAEINYLYEEGINLTEEKDYQSALKKFNEAWAIDKDYEALPEWRGYMLLNNGYYHEAIQVLTYALTRGSYCPIAKKDEPGGCKKQRSNTLVNRAEAYYQIGEYDLAKEDLTEAEELFPSEEILRQVKELRSRIRVDQVRLTRRKQ